MFEVDIDGHFEDITFEEAIELLKIKKALEPLRIKRFTTLQNIVISRTITLEDIIEQWEIDQIMFGVHNPSTLEEVIDDYKCENLIIGILQGHEPTTYNLAREL